MGKKAGAIRGDQKGFTLIEVLIAVVIMAVVMAAVCGFNLNPANIDSRGKYVGTRYLAGDMFYGTINPPSIAVTYNGVRYPNDDKSYYETYPLVSGAERVLGMPVVLADDYFNVNHNFLLNNIGFNIYKGEGSDPSKWQRLYGVDEQNSSKDNLRYDSDYYALADGVITIRPKENPMIKRDINKKEKLLDTCGTYHIVPGFIYANQKNLNNRNYLGEHLIYKNFDGDYDSHYYEQMQCAITLKIEPGMNLELVYQNVNQEKISKWTNFPVPTDNGFPFALDQTEEQSIYYNLGIYSADLYKLGDLSNVTVKCRYIPDSGEKGTYTIELFKEETRGKVKVISDYGTYQCRMGEHKWNIVNSGTIKEESGWKARVHLTFWGSEHVAEVPLPREDGFPTDIPENGEKAEYKEKLICYQASDKYGESWTQTCEFILTYMYDVSTDTYTLTIKGPGGESQLLGVWSCKRNGNEWEKIQ